MPRKSPGKQQTSEAKQDRVAGKSLEEGESSEIKLEPPVASDLKLLWPDIMDSLGSFSRAYFQEAYLQSIEGGVAKIGFPEEFAPQMELADTKETNKVLITALGKRGQSVRAVKYIIADRPADWSPLEMSGSNVAGEGGEDNVSSKPPEGPVDMEEFKKDPLIKKALEVFKGQIVDVRT